MMNGSRKLSNCGEHQVDQHGRQQKDADELAAFSAQLPRLAGVIDVEPLRQDLARFTLEISQPLVELNQGRDDTLDAPGVQLLEFLQLARLGRSAEIANVDSGTSFCPDPLVMCMSVS